MGIRYQLLDPVVCMTTEGDVVYDEGLAVFEAALREAAAVRRGWHLLFDIRESTENRSSSELAAIAQFVSEHLDVLSGRCAVLASDDLHFALGRVFEGWATGGSVEVEVFREEADAWAYLKRERDADG